MGIVLLGGPATKKIKMMTMYNFEKKNTNNYPIIIGKLISSVGQPDSLLRQNKWRRK